MIPNAPKILLCIALGWIGIGATLSIAGPAYDPSRQELESVLADLVAWLPGGWDSYPQVHFERRQRVPVEGEHAHWHHVFERIDAPQIGEVVFYGQINEGGRNAPMLHRSQILYKAWIDEQRGAVVVNGQPLANPDRYVNLHERPELWKEVQWRDPNAMNCDFLWRRSGEQIVGVLDGKTADGRTAGPGTCTYTVKGTDVKFLADAEWVLGPDVLWDYDINLMGGHQFVGRKDRTHIRMFRSRGYDCTIEDAKGAKIWKTYDRGAITSVTTRDGRTLQLMLLRAEFPDRDGHRMHDRLRLLVQQPNEDVPLHESAAAPRAPTIETRFDGIVARCAIVDRLPPMQGRR